jgi:translation initiation factor IF-2
MSEVITPRLMAAAKEFNIGTNTLIEFLVSKNFNADELKPSTKLSEDMYRVLQSEFQQDKAAKQKAEQVDLPKGAGGDPKKKRDEEDLSIKKKEEKPKAAAEEVKPEVVEVPVLETPVIETSKVDHFAPEKPAAEVPVVEQTETQKEPEITKIVAPEIEGLKILDKIHL